MPNDNIVSVFQLLKAVTRKTGNSNTELEHKDYIKTNNLVIDLGLYVEQYDVNMDFCHCIIKLFTVMWVFIIMK